MWLRKCGHRRSALGFSVAAGLGLWASVAEAADTLHGTRGNEAITEKTHQIAVVMKPGWAELTVRREIFNGGTAIDEAVYALEPPEGSVAVGLRSKSGEANATWFKGELFDAEVAAERYLELTGRGEAIPRDPALLYWVSPSSLGLQVFPCAVGKSQWLEYTLLVPTRYSEGRDQLQLGQLGLEGRPASYTLAPARSVDRVRVGDATVSAGGTVAFTPGDEPAEVGLVSAAAPSLGARFASVSLASGRSYDWAELRAAPRISTVPKGAWVVIVADTSVSMGDGAMGLYIPLVKAYLAHLPDAHVGVVAFDRAAREVSPWATPTQALDAMSHWPAAARNGSHVDLALQRARELLRAAPAGATKRVIVLTDARTRKALTQAHLDRALLDTQALVHVSSAGGGDANLSEAPEHSWAAGVHATGGLTWDACAEQDDAATREVFEEWARPRYYQLKRVTVDERALGELLEAPYRLDEGTAWQAAALRQGRSGRLAVKARLWGKNVELAVSSQPEEAKVQAALALVSGQLDLTEEEERELAWKGRAVSRHTSYLAVEPGVRPSTAGIERGHGGAVGSGQGFGSGHGQLGGSHRGALRPFDPEVWLTDALKKIRRDCGTEGRAVTLAVETHRAELLDIPRLQLAPEDESRKGCFLDALWELELPGQFGREDSAQYVIAL